MNRHMKELIIHKSYKCKMYEYYKCKSKNMLFLYCEEKIDRIFTIHCTIFNDDAEFEEYLKNSTDQLAICFRCSYLNIDEFKRYVFYGIWTRAIYGPIHCKFLEGSDVLYHIISNTKKYKYLIVSQIDNLCSARIESRTKLSNNPKDRISLNDLYHNIYSQLHTVVSSRTIPIKNIRWYKKN